MQSETKRYRRGVKSAGRQVPGEDGSVVVGFRDFVPAHQQIVQLELEEKRSNLATS